MALFAEFVSLHWTLVPAVSETAGAVLFAAIWQSAVVAACLAICLRLVPRANAAHRFLIWGSGFAVALLLPFFHFFSHLADGARVGGFQPDAVRPLVHLDLRWSIAVTALWAMCSLYRAADLAIHSVRLRKLWKSAKPVSVETGYAAILEIPRRKPVEICTTRDLERPSVIGFLAPRILIPEWLFARLTPGELDQIVLHETEHLRRGDDWTNLFQKISLIVFPLNPVLLWMERRLCLEREMACDEGVVRVTKAPRAYAACLTSLAERGVQRRNEALSLGVWQRRPELVRRVHSILARRAGLGPVGARCMTAVLGCGLVVGSAELSRCPQLIAFTSAPAADIAQAPAAHRGRRSQDATGAHMENVVYHPDRPLMQPPGQAIEGLRRRYSAPRMTQLKAVMPIHRTSPIAGPAHPGPASAAPKFVQTAELGASTVPSPMAGPWQESVGQDEAMGRPEAIGQQVALSQQQVISPQEAIGQQETIHALHTSTDGDLADAIASVPNAAQQQGWIVLTTWEVIAAPGSTSNLISDQAPDQISDQTSDQDSATNSELPAAAHLSTGAVDSLRPSQRGAQNQNAHPAPGRMRVTQLVFQVFPSQNGSPAAVPVRASWLVIQL